VNSLYVSPDAGPILAWRGIVEPLDRRLRRRSNATLAEREISTARGKPI